MDSLALTDSWDLTVNAQGNIATVTGPAALAQNVASACRTFQGEVYYDETIGIPYLQQVLGITGSSNLVASLLENTALSVPGVTIASATVNLSNDRTLSGNIAINEAISIEM